MTKTAFTTRKLTLADDGKPFIEGLDCRIISDPVAGTPLCILLGCKVAAKGLI